MYEVRLVGEKTGESRTSAAPSWRTKGNVGKKTADSTKLIRYITG